MAMGFFVGALSNARKCFLGDLCPVCRVEECDTDVALCSTCLTALRPFRGARCDGCGGMMDGVLAVCSKCARAERRPWSRAVRSRTCADWAGT